MNIKKELEAKAGITSGIYLNDVEIDPLTIKAVMINEVGPSDPSQDFYGGPDAGYLKTTIPLLQGGWSWSQFYTRHIANRNLHHKCRENPQNRIYH